MKYVIIVLLVLLSFIDARAQFPGTDSLRNYNIVWITNNAARAFTNYRLHTLLAGMIDWIDSARAGEGGTLGIDSIAALNDSTLRYRINGSFRTFTYKGVYDARRKVDTLFKVNDSTIGFRVNDNLRTFTFPGRINFVDSIYRKVGEDSIYYRRDGVEYAIEDAGGVENTNAGLGYRILIPSTQETKTLFTDITGSWDSTSNTDGLTYKVDTSVISTKAWRQKGDDSVAGVLRQVIIDTADAIRGDFPATPTLQQVTTAGNTTTVTIIPDSIRAIRVQSDTLYTFLQPYTADTIYFFGDSYTTGSNATSPSLRYSTLMAARLGLVEKNLGMSGSTLMKRTPIDPYGSVNMIDRLHEIPTYGPLKKYIVIAYGFNDMGVNNANYTPPNFRIDYQQVMDTILARGWPAHRVILISPWYASQATYTGYAGTTGTPANNRSRHLEFIDTAQATATANGARFVNVFNAQIINDSLQLFYLDNIHPGNDGHQIIAQTIYTYITDTVTKNGQALAINGNAEFQNIFYKNIDTVSRYAPVLGIGFDGKIGMFASQRIIKDRSILESQAGNVNMVGKGLFGGVTPANAVEEETLMASGGIKGTWVRANGNLPSLASDSAVEIGLLSATNGYIGAFNRRTGTALGLSVNGLGGNVAVGTTTFTGANRLQVNGNASVSTGFYAGGTTTPTAKIHIAASNGGVSTGPLKFTIGTDLATGEAGVLEYGALSSVNRLAFTPTGTTRLRVPLINDITPAAGSIIQGNGSNFTQLAIGTANQQLRVNAGATALEYFTPSGGSDGNGIYDGSGTLPASATTTVNGGTTSNLNLGGAGGNRLATFSVNSAGLLTLNGLLQLGSANSADADYSIPAGTSVARLVEISATRTVTIPDVGSGQLLIIWNENSSGNAWNISVTGGGVINPDGSSITSLTNDTVYILLALNGNYVRIN